MITTITLVCTDCKEALEIGIPPTLLMENQMLMRDSVKKALAQRNWEMSKTDGYISFICSNCKKARALDVGDKCEVSGAQYIVIDRLPGKTIKVHGEEVETLSTLIIAKSRRHKTRWLAIQHATGKVQIIQQQT